MSFRSPTPPAVFTAGTEDLQLWWGMLPADSYEVEAGGASRTVEHPGGPGAVTVRVPAASEPVPVRLSRGDDVVLSTEVGLLERPAGELLSRFATISDLHIGLDHFGFFHRMRERDPEVGHPMRCARAALDEAARWGATRMFVKGDITERSTADNWAAVQRLFAGTDLPCIGVVGNHDTNRRRVVPWEQGVEPSALETVSDVEHLDLPGLRVILAHSTVMTWGYGRIAPVREAICQLAAEADGPCLVVLHHNLQPLPLPYFWPYGIPSFSATPFAADLARANPRTVITAGHTHRNRVRRRSGLLYSEVGSTKDYPGVWASYEVYEGGIVQVNRRIEARDCVEWLEYTRRCTGGAWGRWTPGRLADRRFAHHWVAP